MILLVGVMVSVLSAQAVARANEQRARQAASTTAVEIASTLTLALKSEQDLASSAGSLAIVTPGLTQAQFSQWVAAGDLFGRYPELLGIANVVMVPAGQLGAFAARAETDPVGSLSPEGIFNVEPPGSRPYYCFESAAVGRPGQPSTPVGLDLCDSNLGPALLKARESGQGAYIAYSLGGAPSLAVGTPIYAGGRVPTTVASREAEFLGWTGTQILPGTILATALRGHPATALTFSYRDGPFHAKFHAGTAPKGALFTTVDLRNGWQVTVASGPIALGIWANRGALALLLGGLVLVALVAVLAYILGTSRSRALFLVDERTDELHHQALHDSLTGLPNRALILDRIGQMLARGRRQHTPVAVLFLDLDNFKDINDTLGHRAGDQLLVGVGARLTSALREGDTVGRLGGDEFVVLTEGASLAGGAGMVADRILDVMSTPFEIADSDVPLGVTASIGFAEGDRPTPEELLRDADIALYQAKAAGKGCAASFAPSMQAAVDAHRHLEVDLQGALTAGQFFLQYQPTVDLSTGLFTGVEALVRWRHPERGVVQPDDFIPALESTGIIVPVGAWVLLEACRQGARWHEQGHRFTVSVNVSARQLERDRIVDDVDHALRLSGFDPGSLVLELTETALMHDVEGTIVRLELLKGLGVRVAVDDFGTGYSSLAYLRQFPIDVLKIDRSFVSGIADTTESAALVHTLVQLGKVLGLETIAEGIETDDQRTRLEDEQVDTGQGFLFARPLDVDDVDRLLDGATEKSRASATASSR
ncbi:MAG: EAL domain-containing protein [Acidimicrobiales bacterium]